MSNNNDVAENKDLLGNLTKIAGILALLGLTFSWEQVLSLPLLVHIALVGLFGISVFIWAFFFVKKHLVSHRDSKQEEYIALPALSNEELNLYNSKSKIYYDLEWLIETERFDGNLNDIAGPFCPQDSTRMTSRKTFLGRYEYECSTCLLKVKSDYNRDTLANRLKRIVEAELTGMKKQRLQKQNENYAKVSKKIKNGLKNMWDDA